MLLRRKRIYDKLDKVYELAKENVVDINEDARIIIFSDQHRGIKDGADDFLRCSKTYKKALDYYFDGGHTLVILGDSEELWECFPKEVIVKYKDSFISELRFFSNNDEQKIRYYRIYGNHDDFWKQSGKMAEYIRNYLEKEVSINSFPVYEGLIFNYNCKGKIFLVHGHQGTLLSDIFADFSEIFVRYMWRNFQRKFRVGYTTPASNVVLAGEHEKIMFEWVLEKCFGGENLLLITGHTHRPVFASTNHLGRVELRIKNLLFEKINVSSGCELSEKDTDLLEKLVEYNLLKLEYEYLKSKDKKPSMRMSVPCYFNTGCCSYDDGDITGIEISDGEIKLIKFSCNNNSPEILECERLGSIFDKINHCGKE